MTSAQKPRPAELADETLQTLRDLADPKRAESAQRYFKEPVDLLGIEAKVMHRVERDVLRTVRRAWAARDAARFCDILARDPHFEPRAVGYLVLAGFVRDAPPSLLSSIKKWLARSCGNWAAVDTLAPSVLGPLLDRCPELIPDVTEWTSSKNMWVRRGAAVAFVPLARKGKRLGPAYRIAEQLLGDEEDLMHKAVGWLLREAGRTDPDRLTRFLLRHGPKVPRTTVRYAIERFPERERKRLLEKTRG